MIRTGNDMRSAREKMGWSQYQLADALRLGGSTEKGAQRIREIEAGKRQITGPVAVATEALLSGWRPE